MERIARAGATTRCEHGEGAIAASQDASVKLGGKPPARLADEARCPGGIDRVEEAARTVLVGGFPAARGDDATAHRGVVVGSAGGVKIGGPTVAGRPLEGSPNTLVAFDPDAGRMFVVSRVEYHGAHATPAQVAAITRAIGETWSGPTTIDGRPVSVRTRVDARCNPDGPPTPGYDRVEIADATAGARQAFGGAGRLPASSTGATAAHAHGLALGLAPQYVETPDGTSPDPATTAKAEGNLMAQPWQAPGGPPPRPLPEHHEAILRRAGLR